MAGADCPTPVQFCAARIARLAADGTTPAGSSNLYVVTDTQITATFKRVYEDGDEFRVKNGCGGIPIALKAARILKWGELDIEFSSFDPELQELLTDGSLITVGGNSDGYAEQAVGGAPGPGVSIELFRKAIVSNQQSASKPWIWSAFPRVILSLNDDTFANAASTLQLSGICYENSGFGNGPNNDWPTGAISSRIQQFVRATTLPTAACGYQATPTQV